MSGERPVLVIHGVANHDKKLFEDRVAELNRRVNQGSATPWRFIPVFWGDLGATQQGVEDTIPSPPLLSLLDVRDGGGLLDLEMISPLGPERLNELFLRGGNEEMTGSASGSAYQSVRSDEAKREMVAHAARRRTEERVTVRAEDTAKDIAEAIRASWDDVIYLKVIDHPGVLDGIGQAIADAVTKDGARIGFDNSDEAEVGSFAVRDDDSDIGVRTLDSRRNNTGFQRFVGRVLRGVDRAVGVVLGEVLGSVQEFLRKKVSRGVAGFVGDVLVYQRNQAKIQQRLWSYIPTGWGTDTEHAVDIIAHSLGGVIVFDAATTATLQLHIRRFVTFGSQPSFFEVIDPRQSLAPYVPKKNDGTPAQAIQLPPNIETWQSLWEPLDPLAFLAGSVFKLSSQEQPTDHMVPHAPTQLWTHSEYWTSDFVVEAIRHALSR